MNTVERRPPDPSSRVSHFTITCSASLKLSLPADSRTIVFGITTLAVAIILPMSQMSGASALPSSAKGVPSTGTRALIGTDSGCSSSVARVCSRPTRSFSACSMQKHTWVRNRCGDGRGMRRSSNPWPTSELMCASGELSFSQRRDNDHAAIDWL